MTCEYFDSDPDDALYNLARRYPGKLPALSLRLGRQESVLRKQLSPAVYSHHLSPEDFIRVIELCAEANVPGAYQPLHAMCFRLEHVAIRLPATDSSAGELFQQVLMMLHAEGDLAKNIQDSLSDDGKIDRREMTEIEENLEKCIGALATLREQARAKHRKDFPA